MSRADSDAVSETVNRVHPNAGLRRRAHESFRVNKILARSSGILWIKEQIAATRVPPATDKDTILLADSFTNGTGAEIFRQLG
jgi:hypothetical protein